LEVISVDLGRLAMKIKEKVEKGLPVQVHPKKEEKNARQSRLGR